MWTGPLPNVDEVREHVIPDVAHEPITKPGTWLTTATNPRPRSQANGGVLIQRRAGGQPAVAPPVVIGTQYVAGCPMYTYSVKSDHA